MFDTLQMGLEIEDAATKHDKKPTRKLLEEKAEE